MSRGFIKNIRPRSLVLEIGSGHNPYPRSDVLCDKRLDDVERGRPIYTGGRPLVISDGESLPFPDKSFDFVICSHVLEHALDPVSFLKEISRVGKGGYIETPSEIWESLSEHRDYHQWLVISENNRLILKKKISANILFGKLYEQFIVMNSKTFGFLINRSPDLFLTRYYWKDKISYQVVPESPTTYLNYNDKEVVDNILKNRMTICEMFAFKAYVGWDRVLPSLFQKKRKKLEEILVCPSCQSSLRWSQTQLDCNTCNKVYTIQQGVPVMNRPLD